MFLCVSDNDIMDLNSELESMGLEEDTGRTEDDEECETVSQTMRLRRRSTRLTRTTVSAKETKPNPENVDRRIAKLYLTKTFKRKPPSLETIFEEPKWTNNSMQYMSIKKFKRAINFSGDNQQSSRNRTKKRQLKAKKILAKNVVKRVKISMELFMQKIKSINDDNS